ncbi:hypothetical protein LX87_05527 [Larkinella arboricola]|uniref:Uncharacterized protein n=1 Tax=Larkinella arboricola TaxID=643671 RepID=A0A327WJD5_LARAB|nr:hypothetical protein [Larkinella arboricola]RAJ90048.1 hypothetical protein LX87_05527 [Larkinella arboricola]
MKPFLILLILIITNILVVKTSNGQELDLGTKYKFKSATRLKPCNSVGDIVEGTTENDIEKGWQFFIEKKIATGYVISFATFPSSFHGSVALNLKYTKTADERPIYYFMPLSEKTNVDIFRNRFFSYGAISAPFKARFPGGEGNEKRYFDLTSNISLGISAGGGLAISNDVSNHILLSASITAIPINSGNTKNFTGSNTSVTALSPAISYIHQRKTIQIGLFLGIDILTGEIGTNWLYKKSPWLGIGIGLNLFSPNVSSVEQSD